MMQKIYKYKLNYNGITILTMPRNALILDVQIQNEQPTIWILFKTEDEKKWVTRYFEIFGTGWDINSNENKYIYITTIQHGVFVWHIFERI